MAAKKKVAKRKQPASRAPRKTPKKSKSAAARTRKKPTARPKSAVRQKKSGGFGRVKIPVDARLDLVFQKDYQAREIFDFLKVQTVRELEHFGAEEIIERLTGPLVQTVQRIRKTLALANRHLAKDEKFAKAFLAEIAQMR
jgi:hypothetical protein